MSNYTDIYIEMSHWKQQIALLSDKELIDEVFPLGYNDGIVDGIIFRYYTNFNSKLHKDDRSILESLLMLDQLEDYYKEI